MGFIYSGDRWSGQLKLRSWPVSGMPQFTSLEVTGFFFSSVYGLCKSISSGGSSSAWKREVHSASFSMMSSKGGGTDLGALLARAGYKSNK